MAATLFHMVTFYMVFAVQEPATPLVLQYGLSLLPNICMTKCVTQIFFFNYQTKDGLTWQSMSKTYQNYSFAGGLAVMIFDVFFWAVLGLYLDQVVPSEYGVARPWNFCCVS